ncbi:MAG: hypothetical protein V3S51_01530 [Dehalococcoidia bacterium]
MVRVIDGKTFFWLMSYLDKSDAVEKAKRYRGTGREALARVIRSKRGIYEVWASKIGAGEAA